MDGEQSPASRELLTDKRAALVRLLDQEPSPDVRLAIESLIRDIDTALSPPTAAQTGAPEPKPEA